MPELASCPREVKVLPHRTQSMSELLEGLSFSDQLTTTCPRDAPRACNAVVVFYGPVSAAMSVRLAGLELDPVERQSRC